MEIQIDEDVKNYIASQGCDFRICTACMGPALVPVSVKGPKETDLRIPVGDPSPSGTTRCSYPASRPDTSTVSPWT